MKKDENAHFGQTIRTEAAPDRSSAKTEGGINMAVMGKSMPDKGTSHSLNPEMYNDTPPKKGRAFR